ncbi:DUF305 domain-containing protein [Psychrobacter sp. I-STPA6b]|uniref:CopM family metallochaperone n=1 Tax=Psychrobacter sp. I-STPA6b TaxID=2585718 RepID=UPI001D0C4358|nr:DUF305 domain-containing protein [Psychrobacter sp. I-STPA6b]
MLYKKNHLLLTCLCGSVLFLSACQPSNTTTDTATNTEQSQAVETPDAPVQNSEVNTDEHAHDHHNHHDMSQMVVNADNEVQQAYLQGMAKMHDDMMAGMMANDPDVAFAKGMLPHHQGAVAMAEVQLKYGKDATMRKLAEDIIKAQQAEIEQMQNWIAEHPDTDKQDNTEAMQQAYHNSMQAMHGDMMAGISEPDPDMAFAKGMLPHHEGAVAMAEVELKYGKDDAMRKLAEDIIKAQQAEIELMQNWISNHS